MFSLPRKVFNPAADGSGGNQGEEVGMRLAGWNPIGSTRFTEDDVSQRFQRTQTVWPLRPVQRGFSLVEMMVVIAIIALLGSVSMPSIRSGLSHLKLARAVDAFVNQVEFARSQAASRNRAYRLQVIQGQGVNRGRVIVTEGWGTLCNDLNFSDSGGFHPVVSVRDVDFSTEHPLVMINSIEPTGIATASESDFHGLCFKPDGRVLQINEDALGGGFPLQPAPAGYGAGEAVYRLTLIGEGNQATPSARNIVVPYNGIPRVETYVPAEES